MKTPGMLIMSVAVLGGMKTTPAQWEGLQPAEEIGATIFREQFPEADGRGTVVVILDTGADPGAPGLQKTTTGEPKLIEVLDATGSGDVILHKSDPATDGKPLTGESGRELTLPRAASSAKDGVSLGLIKAWSKFPGELVSRLKRERARTRDAQFAARQRDVEAALQKFDTEHPTIVSAEEAERREELVARVDAVKKLVKNAEDPGPVYDCVAWWDGAWQVVVDTDADGDLAEETVLRPFGIAQEFGTFGAPALLNFAVQVYGEPGADELTLSVVFDSGMHGTHVAGIVAAHTPGQPELDGIAPGAQLVSIKIGDTRLDGMETPHALRRAANMIRKLHKTRTIDLVNMSYGEPTRVPDSGRLTRTLAELVDDDNIVFVSSAGNSGPALSTVGAPGGTTDAIIGIGAIATPSLMRDAYSMLDGGGEVAYTWSSRGPASDGAWGVDICAPGGAVSSVPTWELQRAMLANGTSMASPNACGGIALALSALRAEGQSWRASDVKRAAENTARPVDGADPWTQGRGMLQVPGLHQALAGTEPLPRFAISIAGGALRSEGRGIYLRNRADTEHATRYDISVKPVLAEVGSEAERAAFYLACRLESSADWVEVPEMFVASGVARKFSVRVDPTTLSPGAHAAEITGFRAGGDEAVVFRVPVTVIVPDPKYSGDWHQEREMEPGEVLRTFGTVPPGAEWAELVVEGIGLTQPVRLLSHAQQIFPGTNDRNTGDKSFLTVPVTGDVKTAFYVRAGATLELALAQFWTERQTHRYRISVRYGGLSIEQQSPFFIAGITSGEWQVSAGVGAAELDPKAQLNAVRRILAPDSAEITRKDDPRDHDSRATGQPEFELSLTYSFDLASETTVRPLLPGLNDHLYDAVFESQLQTIMDSTGKVVAVVDTFAGSRSLKEGDYTLELLLRHSDFDRLKPLENLPLHLEERLKEPVSLPISETSAGALERSAPFGKTSLLPGGSAVFYLGGIEKLPEGVTTGDLLVGKLDYEPGRPQETPIVAVVPRKADPKEEDSLEENPDEELVAALEVLEEDPNLENVNAVLEQVDEGEVARYFGTTQTPGENAALEVRELHLAMKQKKAALFAARVAELKLADDVRRGIAEAEKWGEPDQDLRVFVAEKLGNWGTVVKELTAKIEKGKADEEDRALWRNALNELGWEEFAESW